MKKTFFKRDKKHDIINQKLPPIDYSSVLNYHNLISKEDINKWIKSGIRCFREWYQPVDFGDGIIADVTRPPFWEPAPEFNSERGLAKWNFIVKRNLPKLTNKRVLDLGCNNGIISLQLYREGAKEVIGVDRDEFIHQKTYPELPSQNIVAQAEFVKKAFELKENIEFNVKYIPADIVDIEKLNLGRFDIILALCVLYHEMERMPQILNKLSEITDFIVLQSSLTHAGKLAEWASIYKQVELLHKVGFDKIIVDAPLGYHLPIVVGKKNERN